MAGRRMMHVMILWLKSNKTSSAKDKSARLVFRCFFIPAGNEPSKGKLDGAKAYMV